MTPLLFPILRFVIGYSNGIYGRAFQSSVSLGDSFPRALFFQKTRFPFYVPPTRTLPLASYLAQFILSPTRLF